MSLCIPNPPALIFGRGFITFYEKSEKIVIKEREEGEKKEEKERKGEGRGKRGEREKGKRLPLELKSSALWRRRRE